MASKWSLDVFGTQVSKQNGNHNQHQFNNTCVGYIPLPVTVDDGSVAGLSISKLVLVDPRLYTFSRTNPYVISPTIGEVDPVERRGAS